jgi:hypothetical protein
MERSSQIDYEQRYRQYRTITFAPRDTCRYVEVTGSSVNGGDPFEVKWKDPIAIDPSEWLANRDDFSGGLRLL